VPNVLVTGGAGYIGSHVCKALAQAGCTPIALDNLVSGHVWAVQWGPLVRADIGDRGAVEEVLGKYAIRDVIHLAAYAYVGESMQHPGKYFQNNVAGTLALLDAMAAAGASRLVFSSTCATYGLPEQPLIGEDHPQRPVNPYGESKLFIERALRWYGEAHDLRSVALRYFNAAGADPDGDIGEDHEPETHLIPLVIQAGLGLRHHVDIYGSDYPTRDGSAVRDYIHVSDLAAAHVAALGYLDDGNASVALNLGTGEGHSVREVIRAVERVAGRRITARECPRRPGDPHSLVAARGRAAELLDWQPLRSSLDSIVATAWQWHSARLAENRVTSAAA
jgi:UDP-arabinose 4-epimerase